MDPPKVVSHRRRATADSQLLQVDCDLEDTKIVHDCTVEDAQVDQIKNHARSPCGHKLGARTRLKDVYNGLVTSKELLKVMSRVCRLEQQNSSGLSLFSALKFELERACVHVGKLIQEHRSNRSEIEILFKQFEEEKMVWKIKEQDRIRNAITSIAGELVTERKLRRQTERLNKKLGKELAETKTSLSSTTKELESEKRARVVLEQVCDELARGIGEDRAEVEELKRQSAKVHEEVEKEREMLQLADVMREERVQMKLLEAKYQFEEKTELVDKLRDELESYLKFKMGEEQPCGSPRYDKIKELEKYLRETLPIPYPYQENEQEDIKAVNNEDEEDSDDSADSELHSIELRMDGMNKSFRWSDGVGIEPKTTSVEKRKSRRPIPEKTKISAVFPETDYLAPGGKQENVDIFESASQPWKKDMEDEMERYHMIKDLRDRIVSGSGMMESSQEASPSKSFTQQSVSSNDQNGVICH